MTKYRISLFEIPNSNDEHICLYINNPIALPLQFIDLAFKASGGIVLKKIDLRKRGNKKQSTKPTCGLVSCQ